MANLSELNGNQLYKLLKYIEKNFDHQGDFYYKEAEKLEDQEKKAAARISRRHANKCYKLSGLFGEYIDGIDSKELNKDFSYINSKELADNAIILLRYSLKISSKLRSYKNHYVVLGTAELDSYPGSPIQFNFNTTSYVDVLDESDKRLKTAIRMLKRFDKVSKKTVEKNDDKNISDKTNSNIVSQLENMKKETIYNIVLIAVSWGNDPYTISKIISNYRKQYDSIVKQLSLKERKKIALEKYSVPVIIETVNNEIRPEIMIHKNSYNSECNNTGEYNIIDYLKLNTCLMSAEMVASIYQDILSGIKKESMGDTRYLQINFIRVIFSKLREKGVFKKDTKLSYKVALEICKTYLGVEPDFGAEDFVIKKTEDLKKPKKL